LPEFDTSSWPERAPTDGLEKPGVAFYRSSFDFNVPEGLDLSLNVVYPDEMGPFRSQCWINGWMIAKRVGDLGPQLEVSRTRSWAGVFAIESDRDLPTVPRPAWYTRQWYQRDRRIILVARKHSALQGQQRIRWHQGGGVSSDQDWLRYATRLAAVCLRSRPGLYDEESEEENTCLHVM
jgi:hypothetical protein